ncbi:MAG: phosphatase PAP2 family protein [Lachnospiraceae bacterium]|nr:phosphatase PAP2 family protein [Lachnospiraceae bacterium]
MEKQRKPESFREFISRLIPSYAVLPLIILIVSNIAVYYGTRLLNDILNRPYIDMTSKLDMRIPVIPGFSIVYVLAFPFWYITYFMILRSNPEKCRATVIVNVAAKLLCGVIFVLLPATNVRPVLTETNMFEKLLGIIYTMDAPDNLFPSIHCLESWLCFLFISDESDVHNGIKLVSMYLAIFICLSTLFTKQHVMIDVFSGVIIAIGAYLARRRLLHMGFRFKPVFRS